MLKISNIKYLIDPTSPQPSAEELIKYISQYLTNKYYVKDLNHVELLKKSLDARDKDLYYILQAKFSVSNEASLLKKPNITKYQVVKEISHLSKLKALSKEKILVVGMGPSGLFNAYVLANAGADVTLIDRGQKVEDRIKTIEHFFDTGILNENSNIQFGEGGAGTFSDGKLGTNVSSPYIMYVLETFVKFGAPKEILYEAKPHIGTNVLRQVIINFRNYLIEKGVKVLFNTTLIDFNQNAAIVKQNEVISTIAFDQLVLAVGHSASDIYELLKQKNVRLEPKNFAVGVRIEHLQSMINQSMYHHDSKYLPPAEYKLVTHLKDRSVYTFCMCPGGMVVCASSHPGELVTNGMSNHERNEKNANSALLVGVNVDDYYHGDVLDGVYFLKKYEQLAYAKHQNYLAPVQLVKDFLNNQPSVKLGNVIPSIKPGYKLSRIDDVLPPFVSDALKEALPLLDGKIKGFATGDSILTAIETRSSAPVRVVRNEHLQTSIPNVYAIGEGAGYAGGITTSAIDGIKIAIRILEQGERHNEKFSQ